MDFITEATYNDKMRKFFLKIFFEKIMITFCGKKTFMSMYSALVSVEDHLREG
jgi:hypothetical protein